MEKKKKRHKVEEETKNKRKDVEDKSVDQKMGLKERDGGEGKERS